jgi:photosystem II stability/assembly factor-like uncharacterized protein
MKNHISYICLLLLILGCQVSDDRENTPSEQAAFSKQPVTFDHLFGVDAYGSTQAWVIGFEGTILHTSNGGESWERQKSPVDADLLDVWFVDDKTGWIIGSVGTILKTTDGGTIWIKQNSGSHERLLDICFTDKNTGWVTGTMGSILHTTDGGTTWVNLGFGEDRYYNGVFFIDSQKGWIVGEYSTLFHTEDGGRSWVRQECPDIMPVDMPGDFPPPPPHLYGVFFRDAATGWATGMDGIIIVTEDGGKNWRKLPANVEFTLFKIKVIGNKGWVVGDRGQYLISSDGGDVWDNRQDTIRTRFWLRDMEFTDENHGWIVGGLGTIFKTDDGGNTWNMISGIAIQ